MKDVRTDSVLAARIDDAAIHSGRRATRLAALAKGLGVATACLLVVLGAQVTPASAVTVGGKCAKVGAVAKLGTGTLRCTKVGKRLVWRVIVAAKSTPGPQAEPDALLGTLCATPGYEMLDAAGPLRCIDGAWRAIDRSADSVASRAYRNLMQQYWANPVSSVRLKIVSDSQSAGVADAVERGIRAADRLWSVKGTLQPYPVVLGSSLASLINQAETLGLEFSDSSKQDLASQEAASGMCTLAEYHMPVLNQPWLSSCSGITSTDELDQRRNFALGAHEYTHLAQMVLLKDIRGWRTYISMAPWFQEGLASFSMSALSSLVGDGDTRKYSLAGLDSTTATLAEYNYSVPIGAPLPYSIGRFATEALYALEGPGITEKILRAGATGLKFTDAFKKATGHSLEAWTPILSAYIDSVKARQALTLPQLIALRDKAFASNK